MGGTVNKVAKVAVDAYSAASSTVVAGITQVGAKVINGENPRPADAVLGQQKAAISTAKSAAPVLVKGGQEIGLLHPDPEVQNIAADDPAAVAAADKQARARARRQAEVDLMTDRPGRGGTILTDSYSYKV